MARPEPSRPSALRVALPAALIYVASFLQTEVIFGSWDRWNALCSVFFPSRSNVNDALPAMEAARTLIEHPHAPIYDMSRIDAAAYLYPPVALGLYAPHLAAKESAIGSLITVNRLVFLMIGALVWLTLRGPKEANPGHERSTIARSALELFGVFAAMVLFLPASRALELNQASLYVGLFVGAAWFLVDRGSLFAAGIFLALAGAVKPHLFAIVPLLVFHARRTAISALLTGSLLGVVSLVVAGVQNHVTYITHVLPEAARGYAFFPNQSIEGFLHRLLSDAPIDVFLLMDPSPSVRRAAVLLSACLYGGTFFLLWRARHERALAREALTLAWLVTTMIAPIAWGHHYVAALLPLAWLVRRSLRGDAAKLAQLPWALAGCALLGSYFVVGGLHGPLLRLLASYGLFGALLFAGCFARTIAKDPAEKASFVELGDENAEALAGEPAARNAASSKNLGYGLASDDKRAHDIGCPDPLRP